MCRPGANCTASCLLEDKRHTSTPKEEESPDDANAYKADHKLHGRTALETCCTTLLRCGYIDDLKHSRKHDNTTVLRLPKAAEIQVSASVTLSTWPKRWNLNANFPLSYKIRVGLFFFNHPCCALGASSLTKSATIAWHAGPAPSHKQKPAM
jgi:hypothetical protein